MISQTAEYALRAVVCLAFEPDKPLTTHAIARAAEIPVGYLAKILNALARAKIIASQRGAQGGHVLTRSATDVTLLDVIQVVDPSHRIRVCPLGIESHGPSLCPLHRKLDNAVAAAETMLGAATIADVIAETAAEPSCGCRAEPVSPETCHVGNDLNGNRRTAPIDTDRQAVHGGPLRPALPHSLAILLEQRGRLSAPAPERPQG